MRSIMIMPAHISNWIISVGYTDRVSLYFCRATLMYSWVATGIFFKAAFTTLTCHTVGSLSNLCLVVLCELSDHQ